MTDQLTRAAHYATQSAWRRHQGICAQAAANWSVALEHVQQRPGVSIQELAPVLALDERITRSRSPKSLSAKLSFGRNVDGAMGRAGIRSRKVGRTNCRGDEPQKERQMAQKYSKISKQVAERVAARSGPAKSFVIEQPKVLEVGLEIAGKTPLIMHAFDQKAVEEMLRKHMGLSVQKEPKKPRECIERATLRNVKGEVCVNPIAVKLAMIAASAQIKSLKKTQLRTGLYVVGQSLPITYDEMVPRMDITRLSGQTRTPDVRFRPSFIGWKCRMLIQYGDTLMVQSVIDLLQRAGSVGLNEWRPEKNGTFGTFNVSRHITDIKEIREVRAACEVSLVQLRIPEWAMDVAIDAEALRKIISEQDDEDAA